MGRKQTCRLVCDGCVLLLSNSLGACEGQMFHVERTTQADRQIATEGMYEDGYALLCVAMTEVNHSDINSAHQFVL